MTNKHHHQTASATSGLTSPIANMKMSSVARAKMRATEKAIYHYYNDMGKNKGHCTWGAGILAHKGVCSAEELGRKVSVASS